MSEQKAQLRQWVKLLHSLMPDASQKDLCGYRVQLVASKSDLVYEQTLKTALVELASDVVVRDKQLRWQPDVLATSNKTGAGVKQLCARVQQCAAESLADMGDAVLVPQ